MGGGPAGLYFAILTKKRNPRAHVVVYERNRADDTFGFGVVFSDKTLENLEQIDAESYKAITESFFHWDAIDVHFKGEVVTSRGHGFSGVSRKELLGILTRRAREVGVELVFERDVRPGDPELAGADLIVVADGVNSSFRDAHKAAFGPSIDLRPHRFVWLGTTFPFEAFTFYFRHADPGLFQVHAYRYEPNRSTFIVECSEEVFRRSGLAEDDEAATARYVEKVFERELAGHPLLANRSIWRRFPVVRNARWHHENMVILGDAAHTAHFSIGSGTKLAFEDAIALRDALDRGGPLGDCLKSYEATRRPVVESFQRAAQVSLEWFETTERHAKKPPLVFSFALLTRSLRVTHENLKVRDAAFAERIDRDFEREAATILQQPLPPRTDGKTEPRPPMFVPFRMRDLVLENRVAVSSMCMYSAEDGTVDDFHLVHLGSRAMGGAGLVMAEMTDVSRDGRITPGCAGIYKEEHVGAWKRITDFVHKTTNAKVGLQLGHAGRKGSTLEPWEGQDVPLPTGGWETLGPSALPWDGRHTPPREMTRADMEVVKADFVRAAEMAKAANFDLLELHCAHGYLLATFLSPLTNRRTDEYGGSIENRARFPLDVFAAIRRVWPEERPMSVRVSASDWAPGGTTDADVVALARMLKQAGADLIDVSTGSTVPEQRPRFGRLYQVPFAELVRSEAGIATAAVGAISSYADVNGILAARRADLCFIARAHLFDPYWVRHAAQAQGYELPWPKPYGVLRGYNPRFA
ncbi:MAG: bifunctional salicylyl-CoA 5-hydroxylase/oxidoreductase [Polyangiaceae bacterium]|nr:bifunctional salicylyl-CoA 5-hydroxylase/oxidoreductase [Polyangiaceae bacterium]